MIKDIANLDIVMVDFIHISFMYVLFSDTVICILFKISKITITIKNDYTK